MTDPVRSRIVLTASQYVGKGRAAFGCELHSWCGAFVAHVLRETGLPVPDLPHETQGGALVALLGAPVRYPRPGDIMQHTSSHYGMVITREVYRSPIDLDAERRLLESDTYLIIEGHNGNNIIGCRTARLFNTWQAYSIQPLIDAYFYTGASTGDVA